MKLRKSKVVFVTVTVCLVLFITIYAMLTFGASEAPSLDPQRIPLPELEGQQEDYGSKLEALEDIKAERKLQPPQPYPDHMVDDKGYFNPDYMEFEKQRIVDSILHDIGQTREGPLPLDEKGPSARMKEIGKPRDMDPDSSLIPPEALGLNHQLFFSSDPKTIPHMGSGQVTAHVDGDQTVSNGQRLDLLLAGDLYVKDTLYPKNTRLYGFIQIRPNRVLIELSLPGQKDLRLIAHDFQDGREGIFVKNHLKGSLMDQGLEESVRDINIPGVPQIKGIKRIFQRDHRTIKVAVPHNYVLILKPRT